MSTTLFRGVDRAAFAAALSEALRRAGVAQTPGITARFAAALAAITPRTRDELYWLARTALVTHADDLVAFERVFAATLDAGGARADPHARRSPLPVHGDHHTAPPPRSAPVDATARTPGGGPLPWVAPAAVPRRTDEPTPAWAVPLPVAVAAQRDVPFDQLDPVQLELLGRWLERAAARWPHRPARRHRAAGAGSLDLRRTVRAALRTAGEPVTLVRHRPVRRPRPVVALVDVSGSMEPYTRAYLHLVRALDQHRATETFAFATELTRLTPVLRHRDVTAAVDAATVAVTDRFTGTRVATSLGQLLDHPVWSTTTRGAVVLIASDGADADPPQLLDRRLAQLARRSHRLVWINPRRAAPGYRAEVAGMVAATPYCDTFRSGHSLAAVTDLLSDLFDGARVDGDRVDGDRVGGRLGARVGDGR